ALTIWQQRRGRRCCCRRRASEPTEDGGVVAARFPAPGDHRCGDWPLLHTPFRIPREIVRPPIGRMPCDTSEPATCPAARGGPASAPPCFSSPCCLSAAAWPPCGAGGRSPSSPRKRPS